MIARWCEKLLREMLSYRRGVHLTGARQCGKSTLAEYVGGINARHLTLDNDDFLKAAHEDPAGFVERRNGEMLVIDEIQKAPGLLNAMKIKIDHDNTRGQYLITGSSNLLFMKAVKDSLAGRLGRVRLRTLTLGECQGSKGGFLDAAFSGNFPSSFSPFTKRDALHFAFCGGYPEPMELKPKSRSLWYREYVRDLLTKDVNEVTEIRKIDALEKVFSWMMAYSSKFFDQKALCEAVNLSKETVASYISALKALYVIDEVPSWAGSDYKKLGKRVKYFAADAGLIANILGWNEDSAYYDSDTSGKLIESWVYHELATLADLDGECSLTQYRDGDKREIDFVLTRSPEETVGIEVKAGGVSSDDFKHLKWFASNMVKSKFIGIVLYSGDTVLRFGDGFFAVPLAALAM